MYLHFFPSACCHPKASKITKYYLVASHACTRVISLAFAAFIYLNRGKKAKTIQPFLSFLFLVTALGWCWYLCYLLKFCLQDTLVTLVVAMFSWVSCHYSSPKALSRVADGIHFLFFGTYIGTYLHFFPDAYCHPKASKITIYHQTASHACARVLSFAFAAFA